MNKINVNDKEEVKVYFQHHRNKDENGRVLPTGGETIAYTFDDKNKKIEAYAVCSMKDDYNKKLGRWIDTGRLLKMLGYNPKCINKSKI